MEHSPVESILTRHPLPPPHTFLHYFRWPLFIARSIYCTLRGEFHCAMDAALPLPWAGGADDVVADEDLQSRTIKDEGPRATGAPFPPHDGEHDADISASRRITRHSRMFLAIGIVVEVCATAWAFQQAVSTGALYGDADCSSEGRLKRLHITSLVVDMCNGVGEIEADDFYNIPTAYTSDLYLKEYAGCDILTDAPTGDQGIEERCTCTYYRDEFSLSDCSWVQLHSPSDGICYAQILNLLTDEDGKVYGFRGGHLNDICRSSNPPGTVALTLTALGVALSSELVEAFIGFKYWKHTDQVSHFMPAVSVFEAVGVVAVSSVLLSLPGFYTVSDYTATRMPGFLWLTWTAIMIASSGALAEIAAGCSNRVAGRLPFLGAIGNGLVWLAAALLEVLVTLYLLWTGAEMRDAPDLVLAVVGLFLLELLGLAAMWIARGLWTRARLLRSSLKTLEGPLRGGATPTSSKRWQS